MNVCEKADRLLKLLWQETGGIGKPLKFSKFGQTDHVHRKMMECTESGDQREVAALMMHMWKKDWVTNDMNYRDIPKEFSSELDRNPFEMGIVYVTVEGRNHLEELEKSAPDSSKAFVAMWFDKSMSTAWEQGLKPGIIEPGYEPVKVDEIEHKDRIDDRIIAEIRRSKFIVADFTHGKEGARGGVYYEAGFAHGLNIPVFFTCKKDLVNKLHFDIRQYSTVLWETPEELRTKLANCISAEIGDGPKKKLQDKL